MAVIILNHCTGCGACVAICRFNALTLEVERPDGFGQKRAIVDGQKCCDCDECLIACRYRAIIVKNIKSKDSHQDTKSAKKNKALLF